MAAKSFKVADAYAEFSIDVDKGIDKAAARLKARAKQLNLNLKVDADTTLAEAKLKELGLNKRAKVTADADTKLADAKLKGIGNKTIRPKIKPEVSPADAKKVDTELSRVAQRANRSFDAIKFGVFSAGLPAAATIGALGAVAALGIVPIAFAAVGARMVSTNVAVARSGKALSDSIYTDMQAISQVMVGPAIKGTEQLGNAFHRMSPEIATAMLYAKDSVGTLAGTVTDFAENAMPGMVIAAKSADAPLRGLQSLAGQAGAGLTDFWTNQARGATAAGQSMVTTGGIVRDLEGFLGTLLANLANGSTAVLPQFRASLGQVYSVIGTLTSSGMPALQGATSSLLGTLGGALTLVNGFASGLGSWTAPLGSAAGSIYATNTVAKLFGTSLGDTGFGIRAFGTSIDEAGNKTTPFRSALKEADGAVGKTKAGFTSIMSEGFNPLGIALIGGGLLLDAYGRKQQEAAQRTAEHRENVRTLTDALRADNGALGENVAKANIAALTSKNAAANMAVFGESMGTAKLAIEGNTQAQDKLRFASGAAIVDISKQAHLNETQTQNLVKLGQSALDTGQAFDQLSAGAMNAPPAMNSAGVALTNLNDKQRAAFSAIVNANGAVGEQIKAQADAERVYVAAQAALSGLSEAQVRAAQSTAQHTQAMYDQQNAALGLRGAQLNTKSALQDLADVNENVKSTEMDKAAALLKVEQAFAAQEQAAYQNAYALNVNKSETERLILAGRAADQTAVQLANTFKGPLPASLQQTISQMSVTQAKAAGLTVEIDKAGNAVYRLPNGKDIKLTADSQQAVDAINDVQNRLSAVRNKEVALTVNVRQVGSITGYAQAAVQTGRAAFNAEGALYAPNGSRHQFFAGGGLPQPTQSNNISGIGQWVQPGTYKWSGDAKVPELYLPLDGTMQSKLLLAQANRLMPDVKRGSAPSASSAPQRAEGSSATTNIYATFTMPPDVDVRTLATLVSRELELRSKTGAMT